jgi:hypothetical protein
MSREDVIRITREAGGIDLTTTNAGGVTVWLGTATPEFLGRFAALVAAAEREACARVAEGYEPRCEVCPSGVSTAIRARGGV